MEWDEDAGTEALVGGASTAGNSELEGLLIELCALTTKVHIMLSELDANDFPNSRLATYKALVQQLPEEGSRRRRIGFALTAKLKKKSRRAG